jgi:hypothetical protein
LRRNGLSVTASLKTGPGSGDRASSACGYRTFANVLSVSSATLGAVTFAVAAVVLLGVWRVNTGGGGLTVAVRLAGLHLARGCLDHRAVLALPGGTMPWPA